MRQTAYLLGIMGMPVAHSISPDFHNRALARHQLCGHYFSWPVPPEKLEQALLAVRTLPVHGVSITLPHKERCLPLLDRVDALTERIGAVNTLYWEEDALCGTNTDVSGFAKALTPCKPALQTAFVLGAGGAACAVLVALQTLGLKQIWLSNRNAERGERLAQRLSLPECPIYCCPWELRAQKQAEIQADIVVNATSLGMSGAQCQNSPLAAEVWQNKAWRSEAGNGQRIACDIVYTPTQTLFLQDAARAGWHCVDGMSMFMEQACAQFALWTGLKPDGLASDSF